MRLLNGACVVTAAAIAVWACGRTPEQQAMQQAQQQAQQAQKDAAQSANDMAKGFESMAKGMAEAAQGAQAAVEPVSFRDLEGLFPESAGWERDKPKGEKMTSPVAFSQASISYRKGDAHIEGKIVDSGFNQLLIAPVSMMLAAGYEKETEDGYEKAVKLGPYPGWEKWNSAGKNGELNALVNKRFIVTYEGNGIDDTKVLYDLLQKTDLAKLAAIK